MPNRVMPPDIVIEIEWVPEEDGYAYSIKRVNEKDELYGGLCTGSFTDAVDMAVDWTKAYAKSYPKYPNGF